MWFCTATPKRTSRRRALDPNNYRACSRRSERPPRNDVFEAVCPSLKNCGGQCLWPACSNASQKLRRFIKDLSRWESAKIACCFNCDSNFPACSLSPALPDSPLAEGAWGWRFDASDLWASKRQRPISCNRIATKEIAASPWRCDFRLIQCGSNWVQTQPAGTARLNWMVKSMDVNAIAIASVTGSAAYTAIVGSGRMCGMM